MLLLRGTSLRPGAILVGLGCVILTGFALYNSITGMQRQPLQAPPPYLLYMVLLLIMLGLPIGRDMDGFARTDIFQPGFTEVRPLTFIPTYDR